MSHTMQVNHFALFVILYPVLIALLAIGIRYLLKLFRNKETDSGNTYN
jgi:hypothetical protein